MNLFLQTVWKKQTVVIAHCLLGFIFEESMNQNHLCRSLPVLPAYMTFSEVPYYVTCICDQNIVIYR